MAQTELFESKPKRKKPVMLTGRTRKFLEHEGWITALVERTLDVPKFKGNPFGERFRNKFDAFGFCDVLAVSPFIPGSLYIQVTDHTNHAKHREKLLSLSAPAVILQAGNQIAIHSWKSVKRKGRRLWRLRVEAVKLVHGVLECVESDPRWFFDNMHEVDDNL